MAIYKGNKKVALGNEYTAQVDDVVQNTTHFVTNRAVKNYVDAEVTTLNNSINLKANKSDIVDNLTTNDATKMLSAKQGKALNDTIDAIKDGTTIDSFADVESEINSINNSKQDNLSEGTGIDITSNVVSVDTDVIATKTYVDSKCNDTKNELLWLLGANDLSIDSDESVALNTSIPSGAIQSELYYIGGKSIKSTNLIVLENVAETTHPNGITYKVENGIITLNGTASNTTTLSFAFRYILNGTYIFARFNSGVANSTYIYLSNSNYQAVNNTYSVCDTINKNSTITSTDTILNIVIRIEANESFTNFTTKPMLVSGSTAPTEFSEGFTGLRHAKVESVDVEGFNKFNKATAIDGSWITNVGTTQTGSDRTHSDYISILPSTTYYFKNVIGASSFFSVIWYDTNKNVIGVNNFAGTGNVNGTATSPNNAYYCIANISTSAKDSVCINISGSANGTYTPYVATINKPIPASVQALDGYGLGVSDTIYNYIDFTNKKFGKNVGIVDLGSLNWTKTAAASNTFGCAFGGFSGTALNAICSKYNNVGIQDYTNMQDKTIQIRPSTIYIKDTTYDDGESFETAMSGVYLVYELATPTETDITTAMSNFTNPFEISDNYATVEYTNTHDIAVPHKINILKEVAK